MSHHMRNGSGRAPSTQAERLAALEQRTSHIEAELVRVSAKVDEMHAVRSVPAARLVHPVGDLAVLAKNRCRAPSRNRHTSLGIKSTPNRGNSRSAQGLDRLVRSSTMRGMELVLFGRAQQCGASQAAEFSDPFRSSKTRGIKAACCLSTGLRARAAESSRRSNA